MDVLSFGRFACTATTALADVLANRRRRRRVMGAALEWRATYEGYLRGHSLEEVWSQKLLDDSL